MKQGKLPSECLRDHANELPEECQFLRTATMECKRGMVSTVFLFIYQLALNVFIQLDMRKRFRGNIVGSKFEYEPKDSEKHIPLSTKPSLP